MLCVTTFIDLEFLVLGQEQWTKLVNTAGRQRMLSQRIAKAAERHDMTELRQALTEFEAGHSALLNGDPSRELRPTTDRRILLMFATMAPSYDGIVRSASALLQSPTSGADHQLQLGELQRHEREFLPAMHAIVEQYEARAAAENGTLVLVHLGVVTVTLLVLVAEAVFVFEPTARKLRQQWDDLRAKEERFTLAVRGSQDALWDWSLPEDRVYFSPRWAVLFRDDRLHDASSSEAWFRLVASQDLKRLMQELHRLRSGEADQIDLEIEMRTRTGDPVFALCRGAAVQDASGRVTRLAGSLADITMQREARDRLREMAERDGLTGLANRSYFRDRLDLTVTRAQRSGHHNYAVLSFDFDGFKAVNDALGHSVGDQLLISIARRLEASAPEGSTIARLGGDEFAILLSLDSVDLEGPPLDVHGVVKLCSDLVGRCAVPHELETQQVVSTASIGVVMGDPRYEDAEAVMRDADAAMYAAKTSGKSQARLFDQSMHTQAKRRLSVETRLLEANFDQDFELKLQPIIDLESGHPVGFEALVRWTACDLSDVGPDVFIPIAEEIGVIIKLGAWILDRSAQILEKLDRDLGQRTTRLHVNVSKRQILHPTFLEMLRELDARYPNHKGRLILEITETAVMDRRANLVPRMHEIRNLGFPLAMDDFGTGHSSLACLHQFPLDEIKIDRSFIMNLEGSREFTAIYHAIVSLAEHLGLKVVAEGVETEGQLAQLQAMGCQFGQGYLFDRPLTVQHALAFMRGRCIDKRVA